MLKIKHRINTIEELKSTPIDLGVEVDLRYDGDDIILHHDPYSKGQLFEDYLKHYKHRFIVLNVKSEGIEKKILQILNKFNIQDYFFLDLSLPYLIKYMNSGETKIAVRFSEHEPMEFVLKFKNKVEWVWVDCFTKFPLDHDAYNKLSPFFKFCLVSPELQGHPTDWVTKFKAKTSTMKIDAVCTKKPELW
jgi:hypothetical protein